MFFPNKVGSTGDELSQVELTTRFNIMYMTSQENTIDDSALLLTLRLTQLFGMQPITMKKIKSNSYYVSISPVIYLVNILTSTFLNGIIFYSLWLLAISSKESPKRLFEFSSYNKMNDLLIAIAVIPLSVASIFSTLCGTVRIRCILRCFERIKKIKQDIYKHAYRPVTNRRMKCCLILFASFFPLLLAGAGTWLYGFLGLSTWTQNILIIIVVLLEIQFFLMVDLMNSLFHGINIQLKEVLSQLSFDYTTRTRRSKIALRIHQLMISFVESCKMLQELNSNESFLLFCHIIIFATHILISLYYFSTTIFSTEDDPLQPLLITYYSLNGFYNLFKTFFIIQPCDQTQEEVEETKRHVSVLMSHLQSEDDPLFESVDAFYKQLMMNHYTFTAIGILDIGTNLYSKMVGLAITVIMVIQF